MLYDIQEKLKLAMKNGDKNTIIGLRNIIGKLKTAQIDKGDNLTEEESIKILKSFAKQLKDSAIQFQNGGREDLAQKELFELTLIKEYLPKQLSENKIRILVKNAIKINNAQSLKDMGRIMGLIMNEIGSYADGKLVQHIVKDELSL